MVGGIPSREEAACKKEPGERVQWGLSFFYCSDPNSVSLDSGITLRTEEKGPMPWRTLAACGHLENSQATSRAATDLSLPQNSEQGSPGLRVWAPG